MKPIYEIRKLGRDYCQTEGSDHYVKLREHGVDAIEVAMANDIFEDFAITNIIKYALRFKKTRNLEDLKKVSDYSHILCGVELSKETKDGVVTKEELLNRHCSNCKHDDKSRLDDEPCDECTFNSHWEPQEDDI